ncbi:MAG: ATP-binding protein [Acidobacteriota bacterium]|jgi:MinD superfamily P-loop ATPase|nr:ATP-binding protein [Acidobacteriota bacterium]
MQRDSDRPALTVSVAAGKGGTGKTLLSTSLAYALAELHPGAVQLLDADVEEPNADLVLPVQFTGTEPVELLVPRVDLEKCVRCGKCAEVCAASAIARIRQAVITFHELCTGCGACAWICPVDAITEIPRVIGRVDTGTAEGGIEFVQGRSEVAQQHTGAVTGAVKAHAKPDCITIIDAPPGTACPMQETVAESDYCILVTEPTPFGLSDLGAAVETCRALSVPCGVVVNRDGVGDAGVDEYCRRSGIPILLRIPHDREIARAYSRGRTLALEFPDWRPVLAGLFDSVAREVAR